MFIIPALAMKTSPRNNKTALYNGIFSQPLKISEIVSGNFIRILVGILCLLPSLFYLYSIYVLGVPEGNLDLGQL